ncbi:MAG: hydroxymethylglutaryl-CoA reductase [Candidatus Thorarchaeota archaeon]|nr:hydroxymethylglutaryl-CoA reductase [Candidatus Thorarchaeota archaeon]
MICLIHGGTKKLQIPAFLLRKLYIKGSLENVDDGFKFKIKNSLSPGTATEMDPIKIDDTEYPLEDTVVSSEDVEVKGSEVSADNPIPIKVGVELVIMVKGEQLEEGEHKIDIGLQTKEAGKLAFDVKDAL